MTVKTLMTAEELWEAPEVPGKRFELVRGELVELPGAGGQHGLIVGTFYLLLQPFVSARGIGQVFADGVGYIIARAPDVVRVPDVSFISTARLPEGGIPEKYIPVSPDLAVEIVSPGDRAEEVFEKVREYLAGGSRLVWVVWPRRKGVTAFNSEGVYREYGPDDELDGGEILPGFSVRVAELFPSGR
jgi:Uma2 family endonuclease